MRNIKLFLPRNTHAIPCVICGGYSDQVEPTKEEIDSLGCGRGDCCVGAFRCIRCGHREARQYEAPESDFWDY
jgi:hypothetical protein